MPDNDTLRMGLDSMAVTLRVYTSCAAARAPQVALAVKNPPVHTGDIRDVDSIPGLGRSPGGGHGNPLQYFCLGNPMDRGAWWPTVHGVAESDMMEVTYIACTHAAPGYGHWLSAPILQIGDPPVSSRNIQHSHSPSTRSVGVGRRHRGSSPGLGTLAWPGLQQCWGSR